jgi:putative transposase
VLLFVHVGTRRVLAAACTSEPNSAWVTQQARNLSWQLEDEGTKLSLVIHDLECLDWMLIASEGHLRRGLSEYVVHYNHERPHRSRGLRPPGSRGDPAQTQRPGTINRRERLGGLISEYYAAYEAA